MRILHSLHVIKDHQDALIQTRRYGIDPAADWPCRESAQILWPHIVSTE